MGNLWGNAWRPAATSVCTASFPLGLTVTLTASPVSGLRELDALASWSGGGCAGGATAPTFTDPPCAVTMNAATTVTASFDGVATVANATATALLPSADVNVLVNGRLALAIPGGASGGMQCSLMIPYGDTVEVHAMLGSATFSGSDCTGSGATITANACTFTMSPGNADIALGVPEVIVQP